MLLESVQQRFLERASSGLSDDALSSGGVVHGSLRPGDIGLHCQRADGLLVTNSENFRSMAHRLLTSQRLDDREAVLSCRSQRSLRKHW